MNRQSNIYLLVLSADYVAEGPQPQPEPVSSVVSPPEPEPELTMGKLNSMV